MKSSFLPNKIIDFQIGESRQPFGFASLSLDSPILQSGKNFRAKKRKNFKIGSGFENLLS
jgi:hypothetical protein